MVRPLRQEQLVQKLRITERRDDALNPLVRLVREVPLHQLVQNLSTVAHRLDQETAIVGEIDFVEADHRKGGLSQLGAELEAQGYLLLVELAVLVEQSELHSDFDHVGDDLVCLLVVAHLLPQDEVDGIQEDPHLVVYELLGHGLAGQFPSQLLLHPQSDGSRIKTSVCHWK